MFREESGRKEKSLSFPIDLSYEDPDYAYERGAGKDRLDIPVEVRIIVMARQLKRCALCCDPLKIGFNADSVFRKPGFKTGWIEHIVAKGLRGRDDIGNYAYTCDYCNSYKGMKVFEWVTWEAFRREETIEGRDFHAEYEGYMDFWRRNGRTRNPWPFWARDRDTKEPLFFGFDGKNYDKELSFRLEHAIFKRNIHKSLKSTWHNESSIAALVKKYCEISL